MTEEELAAIQARADAAAAGPWYTTRSLPGVWRRVLDDLGGRRARVHERVVSLEYGRVYVIDQGYEWISEQLVPRGTEPFIAHARDDVPALVAEVRRLRAALGEPT